MDAAAESEAEVDQVGSVSGGAKVYLEAIAQSDLSELQFWEVFARGDGAFFSCGNSFESSDRGFFPRRIRE